MFISFKDRKLNFELVPSTFRNVFDKDNINSLLVKHYSNRYLYNNLCFRLENIVLDKNVVRLELSKTDFYSLLVTNLLYEYIDSNISTENILKDNRFSNNLAISVLIGDINGCVLLTKRTSIVAIGECLYTASITGSFDYTSDLSDDLIFNLVQKEVYEEVGLIVDDSNFIVDGLFIGEAKKQPIILCRLILDIDFLKHEFLSLDIENEINNVLILNNTNYENLNLSEASNFHLNYYFNRLSEKRGV